MIEWTVYKLDGLTALGVNQEITDDLAKSILRAMKEARNSEFPCFIFTGTLKFDESYTKEQGK